MILEQINLHQICQHQNLEVKLSPGLVGIFGPNGAGKSNFVNMIKASITGDFSVNPGVKEDNVRWGIPEDDYAAVTATWQHDGKRFTVRRGLKNASNFLRIEGSKSELKNTKEINAQIEQLIGFSKNIMNFMFVPQWEMFSFISDDATRRNATFSHLCGTAVIGTIHNTVTKQISLDEDMTANVLDNRESIAERIAERTARIAELDGELKSHNGRLLSKEQRLKCIKIISNFDRLVLLRDQLAKSNAKLPAMRLKAKELAGVVDGIKEEITKQQSTVSKLAKQAEAAATTLEALRAYTGNKSRIEDLKEVLKKPNVLPPPEPVDYVKTDWCREEKTRLETRLQSARTLVKTFTDSRITACPTCKTPTGNLSSVIAEAKLEIPKLEKEVTRYDRLLESHSNHTEALKQYTILSNSVNNAKADAKRELDSINLNKPKELDNATSSDDLYWKAQNTVEEHKNAVVMVDGCRRRCNAAEINSSAAAATLAATLSSIEELSAECKSLEKYEALADKAKKALNNHNNSSAEIKIISARLEDLTAANSVDTAEIASITALIDRSAVAQTWLSDLKLVKEFTHKDNFQKLAAQRWLEQITESVNETLLDFESPFYVETGEDLKFIAVKPNGRREPAERLSGGEKVLLALAFRFAVNKLLMGDVGIMILDEPTAGVDKTNVGHMADIFIKAAAYSKSKGAQLIVITHDESLQRAFDQLITIEKTI